MESPSKSCFGTTAIQLRKRSILTWTVTNLFPSKAPLFNVEENHGK